MRAFVMHLQSATQYERIEDVQSFVGQDASGSFGILAGHARSMTVLAFGLARFRRSDGVWAFLALPGALLYFIGDELFISARRYVLNTDYRRICEVLSEEILVEERKLQELKESLAKLERAMLKRLWSMGAQWREHA